jgi:hypothetical protein
MFNLEAVQALRHISSMARVKTAGTTFGFVLILFPGDFNPSLFFQVSFQ